MFAIVTARSLNTKTQENIRSHYFEAIFEETDKGCELTQNRHPKTSDKRTQRCIFVFLNLYRHLSTFEINLYL